MTRPVRRWMISLLSVLVFLELAYAIYWLRNDLWLKRFNIPGSDDGPLYRAEIERIRHGEGYYQAALAEMTHSAYPTRSVFNWRTPLPMWLIGHLPANEYGRILLIVLCLLLSALTFQAVFVQQLCEMPPRQAVILGIATVLLLWGPLSLAVRNLHYTMPIIWAGIGIALSCAAYGSGR
ncbi:MAG: hypothetical protein JXB10_07895, partial [Pirellulales bacterium]|nr:hypothetical protein [Pirellulales bacterium]